MSDRINKLELELARLSGTVQGIQATANANERRIDRLEARAHKIETEQKNQSRWLQEFSEKLSLLGRECDKLGTIVTDMQSFVRSKADQLLSDYHDTIRAAPPVDDDDTDRAIKIPKHE